MNTIGSSSTVRAGDGTSLHVVEWTPDAAQPATPPVLLVHGLASNAYVWEGVARRLAASGLRVVAVDQRGHGRSDRGDGLHDFATHTADLRAVMVRLSMERPLVAGQSWGGNVVMDLAFHHAEEVLAVTCVDGGYLDLVANFADWSAVEAALTPPPLQAMTLEETEQLLRQAHPGWPEEGIAGTLENFEVGPDGSVQRRLSLAGHLAILRALWNQRPARRYPRIRVPVLMVAADNGGPETTVKRAAVEAAVAAIPTARLEWIEGDHDLHAQYPDRIAELVAATADPEFFA